MNFTIRFETVNFAFNFGHKSKNHEQLWRFSLVKEYKSFMNKEVVFAKVLFCF